MPLPIVIPNTFADLTGDQPAAKLDENFAALATSIEGAFDATYKVFPTKADAISGIGDVPLNAYVEVAADETLGGGRTRYLNTAGTLVFQEQLAPIPVDVFTIGGQSNALGYVTPITSPTIVPGTGLQYYSLSGNPADPFVLKPANDPVGDTTYPVLGANRGSAWPSFVQTYFAATGRIVCLVPCAVGGSAQVAAADDGAGNWDAAGALYGIAVSRTNAALAALRAAGYEPNYCGWLWSQGEQDAAAINATTITWPQYRDALQAMLVRIRTAFGSTTPFYIFKTGRSITNDTGYALVRVVQEFIVPATDLYTKVVFRGAEDFFTLGLMQGDNVHYTQAGYIMMGTIGAQAIVSGLVPDLFVVIPGAPTNKAFMSSAMLTGFGTADPLSQVDLSNGRTSAPMALCFGADIDAFTRTTGTAKVGIIHGVNWNLAHAKPQLAAYFVQETMSEAFFGAGIDGQGGFTKATLSCVGSMNSTSRIDGVSVDASGVHLRLTTMLDSQVILARGSSTQWRIGEDATWSSGLIYAGGTPALVFQPTVVTVTLSTEATIGGLGALVSQGGIFAEKLGVFKGGIVTETPAGGAVAGSAVKIGSVLTGTVTPSTTRCLEVKIGASTEYLPLATYIP